jgi:hypothetical protein
VESIKANAGKLGLLATLLAAAVAIYAYSGRGAPARSNKIQFVCVLTGKTYWFERDHPRILPLESPDTHKRTLLPCYQGEDGSLHVSSRCGSLLLRLEQDGINRFVDPETLVG